MLDIGYLAASAGGVLALLAVDAVGMAVPLFVLALLWQRYDLADGTAALLGADPAAARIGSAVPDVVLLGVAVLVVVAVAAWQPRRHAGDRR